MTAQDLVEYGLTTTVLGTGWKAERFPVDHLPPAWWERTDYAWRCSRCPTAAGVWLPTLKKAQAGAEDHARKHPGITVTEIRPKENQP